MREEFEKWAQDNFVLTHGGERYASNFTQAAWEPWQAAPALQDQRVRELEDALPGLLQLAGEDLRLDDIDLCKEMRDGLKALSATARES